MSYRIAVLDLGTNTFNLLLAEIEESGYHIYYNDKIPVKIGENGINQGVISLEAEERALKALRKYQAIIEGENIDKIYGYATSAFRNAANGKALRDRIKAETGFAIHIISGEVEAQYIYYGVRQALNIGPYPALIMDIGGGSVEFVIASNKKIFWKKSYEIGAQRLLDNFHHIDPIPQQEIDSLEEYFNLILTELFTKIDQHNIHTLIGSSGSFDTLSEIYCKENGIPFIINDPEFLLDINHYYKIHEELILKNKEERLQIPGMMEMRVDMIVVASCLINFILKKFDIKNIRVSSHSLKEGMLDSIRKELYQKEKILLS